jgi:hypothetical protein
MYNLKEFIFMKNAKLLSSPYIKNIMSKTINDVEEYKNRDFKNDTAKLFNDAFFKKRYDTYIKYLTDDDFKKKYDEFQEQIVLAVSDKLLKPDNNALYTYIVLGFMVVLQIVILVVKI